MQEEHHSLQETEQRGTEGTGVPTYRTDVRQGSAENVGCEPGWAGTFIRWLAPLPRGGRATWAEVLIVEPPQGVSSETAPA